MRKHIRKEETFLIDLNERGNIKIIHSTKTSVSNKEIQEFEKRLEMRYNNYCEFTDLCIENNLKKNYEKISKQQFLEAMESMLDQNKILKDMINAEEQD